LKRLFDIIAAGLMLLITGPLLAVVCLMIWLYDYHSPFYFAPRVGRGGKDFRMVKLRSMVVDADRTGVSSTSSADKRITPVGHFIRRCKLDELAQMWNVLIGDMSLVGPRPNTRAWGTNLYTEDEMRLLSVRPGITDFASIVFADEGEILKGQDAPDLAYNQLIRPWKSRLGLFYIKHQNIFLDLTLVFLTAVALVSRRRALAKISQLLKRLGAEPGLVQVALRHDRLMPMPPPGATDIVRSSNS
jgi:lipopolysaccharide/colanic/teichoic acid biosynthesis glycosyltransferase